MARRNSTKARAYSPKVKGHIEECIIELAREEGLNTDGGAKYRVTDAFPLLTVIRDYDIRLMACGEVVDEMIEDGHLVERDGKYRPAEQKTSTPMSRRNKARSRTSAVRPSPGTRVAPAPPAYG